jgi:aspartyl-tRNA(Asn)/glutamyl-tRNA(Gln) amidotransferase subunit C
MTEKQIISKEQIKKTAQLARINIDEKEEEKFAKEIGSVLEYFKNISEVEAREIEKIDHYDLQKNQLRKDEAKEKDEEKKEDIRKQFPKRKDDYLKVKAVL